MNKAEKGIKTMELRLESKAQQISEINQQLVKVITIGCKNIMYWRCGR